MCIGGGGGGGPLFVPTPLTPVAPPPPPGQIDLTGAPTMAFMQNMMRNRPSTAAKKRRGLGPTSLGGKRMMMTIPTSTGSVSY